MPYTSNIVPNAIAHPIGPWIALDQLVWDGGWKECKEPSATFPLAEAIDEPACHVELVLDRLSNILPNLELALDRVPGVGLDAWMSNLHPAPEQPPTDWFASDAGARSAQFRRLKIVIRQALTNPCKLLLNAAEQWRLKAQTLRRYLEQDFPLDAGEVQECQRIARQIRREGRKRASQAAGDVVNPSATALASTVDDDASLSPKKLAELFRVPQGPLDSRLRRWRNNAGRGWMENPDRASRDAKYLYRVGSIRHILISLKTTGERRAKEI